MSVLLAAVTVGCQHELNDSLSVEVPELESGSVVTLKSSRADRIISLSLDAPALARFGVWVDLDGDGLRAKDGSEEVGVFNAYQDYALSDGVNEVAVYGDITYLAAAGNELTAIDVSGSPALSTLYLSSNHLTAVNVSQNKMLTRLDVSDNEIRSLILTDNPALVSLWCYNNRLTELDVKVNTLLASLDCSGNQLTHLDVSSNTQLSALLVYNNRLTALDISQNTLLNRLWAFGNELPDNETENLIATLRSTSGGDLWLTEEPLGPSLQARAIEKGWTVAR